MPPDDEPAGPAPGEKTNTRQAQRAPRGSDASPSAKPDGAGGDPGERGVPGAGAYPPGKKRSPRKWRALFFVLASVGIVAAVAWALLGDRLLVVRVVTVSGTHLVTPAQVITAADVPAGTPLIRVDTTQVAARVEAITQVASARVSKDWPDGLSITVTERVPVVAVREAGGGYYLVDHDGVIVRSASAKPTSLPLFQTGVPGSQLRGNHDIATVSAVLAELPSWLYREVENVTVTSGTSGNRGVEEASVPAGSVVLSTDEAETVVWGGPGMAGVKAHELAILMRDRASYYDVSDPNTAVTR